MQFKRELRILLLFLTMAYAAWAEAQTSGFGVGTGAGSVSATRTTTNTMPADARNAVTGSNSTLQQTAPSEVTTVNPMDPVNDSRRAMGPTMPASGATETYPRY